MGFSTRWLLEISSKWNAKVTAVDPDIRHRIFDNPRHYVEQLNLKFEKELEIITAFFGEIHFDIYRKHSTSEPKLDNEQVDKLLSSINMIDQSWNRKFDFIFIDGDHSYKSVVTNFNIAYELIIKGGCIVFHDVILWKEVREALSDIECEYDKKIKLQILGNVKKQLLKFIRKANDGIALVEIL